jgi:hypothetical protein
VADHGPVVRTVQGQRRPSKQTQQVVAWLAALAGPALVTAALRQVGGQERDYVFVYLGLVAVLGVLRGLWPSMVAAV